ncbi:MAG: hypothetical protein AAFN77_22845 [Planctomycetota bacterium]
MGTSLQQVIVGSICLIAAFAFGSYINQNPSLGTPEDQKLSSNDLGLTQKGIEPMPNLQHRLHSKVTLDDLENMARQNVLRPVIPEGPKLPGPDAIDERMNLALPNKSLAKPKLREVSTPSAAPDFSDLADSIEKPNPSNPALGKMPTVSPPASSNIKNIADSFRPNQNDEALKAPQFLEPDGDRQFPKTNTRAAVADQNTDVISKDSTDSPFNTTAPSIAKSANSDAPEAASTLADAKLFAAAKPTARISPPLPDESSSPRAEAQMNSVLDRSPVIDGPTSRNAAPMDTAQQSNPSSPAMRPIEINRDTGFADPGSFNKDNPGWNDRVASMQPDLLRNRNERSRMTRLPLALTDDSKVQLVRLRGEAVRKIELETTRFTDHIVMSGETLQSISTRYHGKPNFYLDIYLANRDRLRNPVEVPQGIVLKIPLYE